ncbi:MAG TPA: outer membrane lipoprotein-sorting protein [Terracidiphilus sp.]
MKLYAAAILAIMLPLLAHASDARSVIATPKQRIETADYRLVGRIIRVDENGARTNFGINLKAHWFPGVLRVLLDVTSPPSARLRVLMEMRPDGQTTMKTIHPGDKSPAVLPFEQWTNSPFGPGFGYEDFLDPELYWPTQAVEDATYGARKCDLLTSVPGAADRTHYSKVRTWLDHTIVFPVHADKTLKGSGTVKDFSFIGLRHEGGVWSASQVEGKLRGNKGTTLLIVERGSTKAHLSMADFSSENLVKF